MPYQGTTWVAAACLCWLCLSMVAHASPGGTPPTQASAAVAPATTPAAAPEGGGDCCGTRPIFVPVGAYVANFGVTLGLLLACYLILRARRIKAATVATKDQAIPETAAVTSITVHGVAKPPSAQQAVKTMLLRWYNPAGQKEAMALMATHNTESALGFFASMNEASLLEALQTSRQGLTVEEAAVRLTACGENSIEVDKPRSMFSLACTAVLSPFNGLMLVVAILTICPPNNSTPTFVLIMVLLTAAVVMRFLEELRSRDLPAVMASADDSTATVLRCSERCQVDITGVVQGDVVFLSAGDLVPGDVRVLDTSNLFVGMSCLTGESMPVEKRPLLSSAKETALAHENVALMGSFVVSGSATGVVVATGAKTYMASVQRSLPSGSMPTAIDKAVRRIVLLFIAFIVVMVPIVITLNGTLSGTWSGAVAFGLAVAVGLTPQMLPMIVTANLSRSVRSMRAKQCVVKRMDAVQNLGAMDVLCTDKTGTLTVDEVTLLRALDSNCQDSVEVLQLAFANSHFQVGLPNLLDKGVIKFGRERGVHMNVEGSWQLVDEIPFDFERRLLSVILRSNGSPTAKPLLICKGALEELLARCSHVQASPGIVPLDEALRAQLLCEERNQEGLRVLGLATRELDVAKQTDFCTADETGLLFCGFLGFLDPLKTSAIPAIQDLLAKGIAIKVLTGDSLPVAQRLCAEMRIPGERGVTGAQLMACDDDELAALVERCTVFAKVTPQQKMRVVGALQARDHIVGFLGDGTNDALALRKADVGVSVDSGTPVARQAADLLMLDKDLGVLSKGVTIGRQTYGNTIKYIKFASSSSFGNTFSILAAAAWLPFTPLQPIQVLVLNVFYNISQLAIPWDTMDPSFLETPKRWSAKFLGLYMLIIGPVSSVFDICTFLVMWYFYKLNSNDGDNALLFQTAWFQESLLTQTFIVHLLRTEQIPFIQSTASWPLLLSSFGSMAAGIAICYIPGLHSALQLTSTFPSFYGFLVALVIGYCAWAQLVKMMYIRVFDSWL